MKRRAEADGRNGKREEVAGNRKRGVACGAGLPNSESRQSLPHATILPMLLDHLYAAPYTKTAGDRTSDLLGWRRMRTAW